MSIFTEVRQGTSVQDWQRGQAEDVSGYRGFASYPTAYQAAAFPYYGDEVRITGNNQAFFFVKGKKNEDNQVVIEENTFALKTLIRNIVAQGETAETRPSVRLQIDADVFENPKRFVDKYQALRSEPYEMRRHLLGREAEIIRHFVQNGGIRQIVEDVLQENALDHTGHTLSSERLKLHTDKFLEKNFRLEGVHTHEEALPFATWEIKSDEGTFLARQEYSHSTYMTDRPWQLGIEQELSVLAGKGHSGAGQVLEAAEHTRNLTTVNLTYGQQRQDGQGRGGAAR